MTTVKYIKMKLKIVFTHVLCCCVHVLHLTIYNNFKFQKLHLRLLRMGKPIVVWILLSVLHKRETFLGITPFSENLVYSPGFSTLIRNTLEWGSSWGILLYSLPGFFMFILIYFLHFSVHSSFLLLIAVYFLFIKKMFLGYSY